MFDIETIGLTALLVIFAAHLAAFAVLAVQRRQGYYVALVITFALLIAAIATRLIAPELGAGEWPLHRLLRYVAWLSAAVSISWTLARLISRRREVQRGRQNCS